MRTKILHILVLFVGLLMSATSYAQQTLMLGNYETPDQSEAWDGFNLQNAPVIFNYSHSGSQVLYQPEQLTELKGQQITSMSFKCFTLDCYNDSYTSTMKLFLSEFDGNEFPYDAVGDYYKWLPIDESKVLATTEFVPNFMDAAVNGTDVEVTFDLSKAPYVYTGKTLVVTIVNDAPDCISDGTIQFYWVNSKKGDPWSSAVYGSDNTDFLANLQKNDAIQTTSNEDKWKNVPMVKFAYEPATENPNPAPDPEPQPAGGTLLLGDYDGSNQSEAWDGYNLQNAPIAMAYAHSGSQVIYTAEELASMAGQQITSMSFKCFSNDCYDVYTSTMKVYLQEIDAKEFSRTADGKLQWVEFDATKALATTDFTGDFLNSYGEDIEVTFDLSKQPYVYSGKSLVVTVVNDTETVPSGTVQFYWVPSKKDSPWRSLVYGSDDVNFLDNQKKDILLNGNEDKWKNAPAVKFVYEPASEVPGPTPDPEPTPEPKNGTILLGNYETPNQSEAWDGFNLQNAPIVFTYSHSGSQVLYQPEQLAEMKGQLINSMSFKCFTLDCYNSSYTSTMKLYLSEIDGNEFPYDAVGNYYKWIPFDKSKVLATTEFAPDFMDAAINGTDVEVTFDLSKSDYVYTGKTLVVTIVNDAPESIADGTIQFYWVNSKKGDPWGSAVYGSDNTDFLVNLEKNDAIQTTSNEDKWKNVPMVKIVYGPGEVNPNPNPEPPVSSDFSGGQGTMEAPYLISKIEDLDLLDEWTNSAKTAGKYFLLTQDLVDTPYTKFVGMKGNFEGHFDGGNHCVALDINAADSSYVGFIGAAVGGSVKNLQVKGKVVGGMCVGGVLGQAALGTEVENLVNYCEVNGAQFVGGVIGQVISQEGYATTTVRHCVNYGHVVSSLGAGGVIGDAGQQISNLIERIANYGYVDCKTYAGGLIGNTRPEDIVRYGLNVGTSATNKVKGCIGNSKSPSITDLYYDDQLMNHPKVNLLQKKTTVELLGTALESKEANNGFSSDYWLFTENLYPRLKVNGVENTPLAILYATPVILAEGNTLNSIDQDFTVVTANGVVWSSKNGNVEFNGEKAVLKWGGEDVLVATLDGVSRELPINITVLTGIEEMQGTTAANNVKIQQGAIDINLSAQAEVKVMNMAGQVVAHNVFGAGVHHVQLAPGVYVVSINHETVKVCINR